MKRRKIFRAESLPGPHEARKQNWKQASFTVEASLVFPFFCLLLAVMLQMILYLHDVSLFVSAAYEAAQKGAAMELAGEKERAACAKEQAYELLREKRLACESFEAEAKATETAVQVQIRGYTGWFGGMSIQVRKEAECIKPVKYLRRQKKVKGLWEKWKGEEESG